MRNYLREAIEKQKLYYIQKLEEASAYNVTEYDLRLLTLTELQDIYYEYYPHIKNRKSTVDWQK